MHVCAFAAAPAVAALADAAPAASAHVDFPGTAPLSSLSHFPHVLAIVADRSLFCIRELRSHHVPMLKRMHDVCVLKLQEL
jgi:hypothetical protein